MEHNVQAAFAVLACTFCIALPGASQEKAARHDVEQGPYVSVNWAELTHRNDGWQITSNHELGQWNSPLLPGDLLLQIDGVDVSHLNPLSIVSLLVDAYFRDVTVTVQREGRAEEVNLRVGQSRPDEYMTQFYQRFGIGASLMAQKEPAAPKIGDMVPGSPADRAGLKSV